MKLSEHKIIGLINDSVNSKEKINAMSMTDWSIYHFRSWNPTSISVRDADIVSTAFATTNWALNKVVKVINDYIPNSNKNEIISAILRELDFDHRI